MTQAINILPNIYTRLGEMGLFRFEGITQRSVIIEQAEGVLNLLPTVPLGGPATVANRDARSMRSFTVPWIPHDDVITPQDIQGVRGFGVADAADPLATVMERKLTRMRAKHAQTREYMEINALRGIVKDGAGVESTTISTSSGWPSSRSTSCSAQPAPTYRPSAARCCATSRPSSRARP
jgi:Phage major capsid protein E